MTALSFGGVSLFYLLIAVAILMRCLRFKFVFSPYRCKGILWISFFVLLSMILNVALCDYSMLEGEWKGGIVKNSLTFVLVINGISLLYKPDERACLKKYFVDGLYASCICQLIWGFLELIFWNLKGININEIIFQDFLHVRLNVIWTFISGDSLRIAGIGWEPAYFSLAMVAGYLLSSKQILKYLFVLFVIISSSRTGIIMMVFAIVSEQLFFNPKEESYRYIKRIIYIVMGILFFGCCIWFVPSIRTVAESTIMSTIKWNTTTSGRTHFLYIQLLPDVLQKVPLGHILFGYGYGGSGIPYMLYTKSFAGRTGAWAVESELLNIFWGLGIPGGIAYYSFIVEMIIKNADKTVKILAICLLAGGPFYVYSGTWLMFFLVLVYDNKRDRNEWLTREKAYIL